VDPRHNLALLPVEKDSINGLKMIRYLAMIAAWVGDKDLACEQLAIVVHSPDDLSHGNLKLLTLWEARRACASQRSSNSKL
jgi:hypothetical protein